MRKKHKIYQSPTVRIEPLPKAFAASVSVSNLQEQKDRFLKHGKTPMFVVQGDTSTVEELAAKTSGKIRFNLLGEAEYIIRTVKQNYGVGENYLEHIYGPRIEQDEANQILFDYMRENSLQESLAVYWSNEMPCSARMMWKGYSFKCNRPEARRYSLWLNGTDGNPYLRKHGLRCLLDHEIGTHFYRSYNDGFQPWFYDRKKFGLRGVGSFESLCTEEGLAAINTTLRAKEKYLWLSALTYYTACKSTEMTFRQLFDHLGQFVQNPEQRWKHVMRVKRGLVDPNDLGGYGKDQCYFEGAVSILRNIDDINFNLLMSGKICYDEVSRVKRLARLGSVCLPAIMRDIESYRRQLKEMAVVNGLHLSHPEYEPPRAYVQRLKERQAGISRRRKVRKGQKLRASLSKVSCAESENSNHSLEIMKQSLEHENVSVLSSKNPKQVSCKQKHSVSDNDYQVVSSVSKSDSDKQSAQSESTSSDRRPSSKPDETTSDHSTDGVSTKLLVIDSNYSLDDQHAQTSSCEPVASNKTLVSGKERPHTATEFHKTRLSYLHRRRLGQSNNSNIGEIEAHTQTSRDNSVSSQQLEELYSVCTDSTVGQLTFDAGVDSWLHDLPQTPPSISPFSEGCSHSPLPPISPRQIIHVVTPRCVHNQSSSDFTLAMCKFSSQDSKVLSPPFRIKGNVSKIPIAQKPVKSCQ